MTPGRKANGQFEPGASGNPNGRPKKEREERFLEITLSAVTYKDWREIIKRAVEQAKKGNPQARKFLADYLVGTPVQKSDIDLNVKGALDVTSDRLATALELLQSGANSCNCGSDIS